ncbi:D-alanyl-D-alanine carboxypeptidase/D-alanyl-D-alanine-endopeptidase [Candidatus Sumerlaeota bacterium]|nr:D-alanyl-D-alanine carboxypeptidase/D-alanyl-D-alanine-endopeptidase [Candidatus Sumerlaeota bacterium]
MMKKPAYALLASMVIALGGCAKVQSPVVETAVKEATPVAAVAADPKTDKQELVRRIAATFDDERFANAHWGVLIKSIDSGEVWYARNENRLFNPASNEKIPTTASALLYLGPDFKFETSLCHTGEISGNTINGDLVVFGNGDPTLYTRLQNDKGEPYYKDSKDAFRAWAKVIKEKGITHVTGNVVGDDNAWDDEHTGNGWPFDELTPWYYAEYGALQFNENYVDVKITPPATVDGTVTLTPNVTSSYFKLINDIKVSANGSNSVDMYRPIFSNEIRMSGTVKAGTKTFEETPTITNPTLYYVTVLSEVLQEEGIKIDGKPMDCDNIDGWKHTAADFPVLSKLESPPLFDILKGLMKRSQNMYAETMAHTMGWKKNGIGTFRGGREVVYEQLQQFGITPRSFQYSDGSGLSRYDYISPAIIVKIYEGMYKHPLAKYWWETQTIAGVDGTLRNRFKGTKAEGNLRGKTGTISNVRALSGYVKTAGGEQLAFSFLVNAHLVGDTETNGITDSVGKMLAEFEGPAPAKAPAAQ